MKGGVISTTEQSKYDELLTLLKLPNKPPSRMSLDDFLHFMYHDKKTVQGTLTFILLHKIGDAFISSQINKERLTKALEKFVN